MDGQHNGQYNVTITATDENGNSSSCIVILTAKDVSPPDDYTCPPDRVLNLDNNCQITVPDIITGLVTTDNCGIVTFTQSPAAGTLLNAVHNQNFNFHVTASDGNGNFRFCTILVTAKDVTPPVITYCPVVPVFCHTENGIYTIPELTATDNCTVPSISYVITGATSRSGNNSNASGAFNPGTSTINWTVNDGNGNIATCNTTVTIDKVDAAIPDVYAANITSSIGNPNTIYIGYGGSSVTLSAQVSSSVSPDSYSYKWTIGSPAGPGFASTPNITVSPTTTTTYYLSIKDNNNCAPLYQVSKQINVIDITCGTGKIWVCEPQKNGTYSSRCVSSAETIRTLKAGWYLGQCPATITATKGVTVTTEQSILFGEMTITASPNPTTQSFSIIVHSSNKKEKITVRVVDILGRVIANRNVITEGQTFKLGENYSAGIYLVEAIQGKERKTLMLIKQ